MFAEKAEPAAFNEIIKGDDSNCNEKLGKISPVCVSLQLEPFGLCLRLIETILELSIWPAFPRGRFLFAKITGRGFSISKAGESSREPAGV